MKTTEQGYALIRKFEGLSLKPYRCPAGKNTIGYGHVIGAGERFPAGGITINEAEAILHKDVYGMECALRRMVTAPVTQNQWDALMSFIYNVGPTAFAKSTLLRFVNEGKMAAAAEEFSKWMYGGGKKLPGLAKRRAAEAAVFSAV